MHFRRLTLSVALFLVLLPLFNCQGRGKSKRSVKPFNDAGCYPDVKKSVFGRLEQVCFDCSKKIKKSFVIENCKRECYTTNVFQNCLYVLKPVMPAENMREITKDVTMIVKKRAQQLKKH